MEYTKAKSRRHKKEKKNEALYERDRLNTISSLHSPVQQLLMFVFF